METVANSVTTSTNKLCKSVQNLPLTISSISIHQDEQGRYSLNDLHRAAGGEQRHRPKYWLALQQTVELIEEILKGVITPFGHKPVASRMGRYGGTYVCKELVYSYAMWISAAFALKVIRAYDALVSGNVEAKSKVRQCTATQLIPLRQTAERLITTGLGTIYPDIWKLVHQRFDIRHIHQLRPEQVGEAVEYLNALEGEFIGRETQLAETGRQFTDEELCTLAWLWRASTVMIKAVESIYPLLEVAKHEQAPRYYSITHEYPRTLRAAQRILTRATKHKKFDPWDDDNWSRVLPHLRHKDLPHA